MVVVVVVVVVAVHCTLVMRREHAGFFLDQDPSPIPSQREGAAPLKLCCLQVQGVL
jgi:hypothetical protein